ncbi:MAG: hypothetical protein FWC82_02030 [Firmicutes bacterium]|nr:hypothetical protein [Bacillota bacterium]
MNALNDEQLDQLDKELEEENAAAEAANAAINTNLECKEERKGLFARFKSFFGGKEKPHKEAAKDKGKPTVGGSVRALAETSPEDSRRLNDFLNAIEVQLDKVDEKNSLLLSQITTLKDNNEILLDQVKTLTHNNNQLAEQYNNMKKREKIAKIMAIVSASLAISVTIFTFIWNVILPAAGVR